MFYVSGLVAIALGMATVFVFAGYGLGTPAALGAIAVAALVAERGGIRLTPTIEASTASLPFIFAGAVFGPLSAMLVGAVALLPDLFRRDDPHPYLRWVHWTASRAVAAGVAGLVVAQIAGLGGSVSFLLLLGAVMAACFADSGVDLALASVTTVVRGQGRLRDVVTTVGPLFLASVPLYAPVIAVLAFAYRTISPWSAALFVIPAFAAQRLFLLYGQQRETAEELTVVNLRLEKANLSFATALVATLDARDRYTAGHSAAVAIYARDIAARMGLPEAEQSKVHLCGLVHDIGKIGLPAGLLEKPGVLALDERRQMELHPVIGERILANVEDYAEIASIVRHHHERIDGYGYPDELGSNNIPLLSRIIAVADAYNAMTSDRPYRDAMPSRVARLRLAQAVESQFDTSVVAAFEAILTRATEEYLTGRRMDFGMEMRTAESADEKLLVSRALPGRTQTGSRGDESGPYSTGEAQHKSSAGVG